MFRPIELALSWGLLLLLAFPLPGEEPAPVRLADDFRAETRKDYQVRGEVTWQNGQVTLGPNAALTRAVQLGHAAEVYAVVRLPEGKEAAGLEIRLQAGKVASQVALRRNGGRTVLVSQAPFAETIPLQAGAAGPWAVRVHLRYGQARARAWLADTAEPKEWQTVRYSGLNLWEPRELTFAAAKAGGASLVRWTVTATSPAPPPGPQRQATIERAQKLEEEIAALFRKGRARAAADRAFLAWALQRQARGEEHPDAVTALSNLGAMLRETGDYASARWCFTRALALQKQTFGDDHSETAAGLNNLGLLHHLRGEYPAARSYYEQAYLIRKKVRGADHPFTAQSLHNLGSLLKDLGDYAGARRAEEQALASRKKVLGPEHPFTVVSLNALGVLLQDLGEYEAARPYLEQALKISEEKGGAEHPHTLVALNNLGRLFQEMGDLKAARPYLERALAIRRQARGDAHPETAVSRLNLGSLLDDLGEPAAARTHYEQALAAFQKALGDNHPRTALCRNNLAVVLYRLGDDEAALRAYEAALASRTKVLGPDHPDTAAALNNLGGFYAGRGKVAPAWDHLLRGTATLARANRKFLAGGAEHDFGRWLAFSRNHFDALLSLAVQNPDLVRTGGLDLAAAVLDWKAATTQARLARQEALTLGGDPAVQATYRELVGVRQRLAHLLLRGPGAEPVERFQERRGELEADRDRLERDLAQAVDAFAVWQRRQQAGPREVARRLPTGAVLVELLRYDPVNFQSKERVKRGGPPRYAALLLGPATGDRTDPWVRFVSLGEAGTIDNAVHAWRRAVQAGRRVDGDTDQTLRRRVWGPLAGALPEKTSRLLIVPDGELALLPFEAIRLADDRYLIERFRVSYLSGGRDLLPRPAAKQGPGPGVLLSDPDFDAIGARPAGAPDPVLAAGDLGQRAIRFGRLPGFAREAAAVTRAWDKARPGEPLTRLQGSEASEEKLAAVRRPRWLYFITHGFFLSDLRPLRGDPSRRNFEIVPLEGGGPRPGFGEDAGLRSGLALAGAHRWQQRSQRGQSDGLLTALEAQDLDLWDTELVVLSACETGLGKVQVGEGVLGLRRAFRTAGAQTVLASLWKVPDAETERLMSRFFELWLAGKGKAEALRTAQLEVIGQLRKEQDPQRHSAPPLFWAGFICHGQPE